MCKPPPEVTPPERAPIDVELLAVAPGPAPAGALPASDEQTVVPPPTAGDTAIPGAD
jgi:hypothetical protein